LEKVIQPRIKFSFGISELWAHRELLYFFTWRDIKIRYKQAVLGVIWTILQPLMLMIIFTLFLSGSFRMDTGQIPVPVYYLCGIIWWNFFYQAVNNASQSMVGNANLIKKIYFPRLIIPISAVLTAAFDFLIQLLLLFGLIIYFNLYEGFSPHYPALITSIITGFILCTFFAFGTGTLLSAINVKYRDVRYALPFFLQGLFFLTPVIYTSSAIPSVWVKNLVAVNPLDLIIVLTRSSLDNTVQNALVINIIPFIFLIFLILAAIYIFRNTEAYFADII
jgi:lipopolysaccharide transport system permease protein